MKEKIFIVLLCVCALITGGPMHVHAAENAMASSFSALAEDKPVYALLYNAYEYEMRKTPQQEDSVVTVPGGQQLTLLECVEADGKLWFRCETAVDDVTYQGFVEQQYIISADLRYNQWLNEFNARNGDIKIHVDKAGGTSVADTEFVNYVTQYFPYEYRAALIELHQKHPQWKFVPFYTGLDWDYVIDNEMVPTRNLVYWTAPDEWKSKAEGDYDPVTGTYIGKSGPNWLQASRTAVEHFMDPTNFLDEKSIFMFEQLTYDTGTHVQNGVEAILKGTWMYANALEDGSWPSYASAFMEIALQTGVSPYHLASRIRLEQGVAGTSRLISGVEPGYEGYYNYFNVKASGATNEEIVKNGLTYAKNNGWNTRFAALLGGARVISGSYISKGQDTLYLQKFDVDPSYNGLFSHQYMQNVQAPYTEGRKVYDAYKAIGNLENNFVFKIPVYNKMGTYEGNINSELKSFSLKTNEEGKYYLQGEIVVVEWVDGVSTVPREKPIMYFESTDGQEKIDVYVTSIGTNTYYFDRFIEGLTVGREYVFKVISGSDKNVSATKGMTLLLSNSSLPNSGTLGRIHSQELEYGTNAAGELVIGAKKYNYAGNINSELKKFALNANGQGATYLSGEIVVVEWVDGVSTVPDETPVMKFKSVSGAELEVFVTPTGTNTYYFDRFIEGLAVGEEYYFEISSGSPYNVSDHKTMRVNLDTSPQMAPEAVLGEIGGNTLVYRRDEAGQMVISCYSKEYVGDVNSQLNSLVGRNIDGVDYIGGEIIVVEWVNGVATVPAALPVMHLVSADGVETMEVFVTSLGTNTFYFDRSVSYLRPETQYTLTVQSGSSWNQSDHKSMVISGAGLAQQEGLLCQTGTQDIWFRVDADQNQLVIYATENR